MFVQMKQFVPSAVCLKCDGCCRFKEEKSLWQPKMTVEEERQAKSAGLADKIFSQNVIGHDRCIKTTPGGGTHLCSFLDFKTNACTIYPARPFECQLYPFVISKDDQGLGVFVHLNCPFVQENEQTPIMVEYVDYLRNFFQDALVKSFLEKNKGLMSNYSFYKNELKLLFNL